MFKNFRGNLRLHTGRHKILYLALAVLLLLGISIGAAYFQAIREDVSARMGSGVETYIRYVAEGNSARWGLFFSTFTAGALTVVFITAAGLFRPLLPVSFLVLAGRGFYAGYSVAFIAGLLGWEGTALILCSMVPQYLLLLPIYVFAAALPVLRLQRKGGVKGFRPPDAGYLQLVGICVLWVLPASLYNAFVSPFFLQKILALFSSYL